MGTNSFIIIKVEKPLTENRRKKQRAGKTEDIKINLNTYLNQFCLLLYNQIGGCIDGIGIEILKFLRKITEENKWEEFCEKCKKLKNDFNHEKSDEERNKTRILKEFVDRVLREKNDFEFSKIKTNYVKDDNKDIYKYIGTDGSRYPDEIDRELFEKITRSPETLQKVAYSSHLYSRYRGAKILDMIMTNQVDKTNFCDKEWPCDMFFCEYGYIIDCTNKEFLIYSIRRREDESKAEDTDEEDDDKEEEISEANSLSFLNTIPLCGRFSIDKREKKLIHFQLDESEKNELTESELDESESEESESEESESELHL